MITIKCNPYTEKEVSKLNFLITKALDTLCEHADGSVSCPGVYGCDVCNDCPYKHICYDLNHCQAYLDGVEDRRDTE